MRFNLKDLLILLSFPAIMSIGQIMFREAAVKFSGKPVVELMMGLLRTPIFHGALVFYAFATVLWVWLLSRYPLAVAYPIAVMAVVFTPLIDRFVFRQSLPATYWPGLGLLIVGVLVIVKSKW